MNTIQRYSAGGVAAAGVTLGLGAIMAAMIAVEFAPQDKPKSADFEINPVAEDIAPPDLISQPEPLKKIQTPPPPPRIEQQVAVLPSEPIASVGGSIPVFKVPKIDKQIFDIAVSNKDAQPRVRIAPIMPLGADKSGHCKVRFDVSPQGAPYNVSATYCTDSVFKSASIKSVQKWKYAPKMQSGRAVAMSGVESRITFQLTDDRGRLIPE